MKKRSTLEQEKGRGPFGVLPSALALCLGMLLTQAGPYALAAVDDPDDASDDASGDGSDGAPDSREAVFGRWASSGTIIDVSPTDDGGLSARIIALKHPRWREKDRAGVVGEPKTDLHNPDRSRRDRPLLGLEMLSGYRFERGRWHGRLYLPTNGSTWNSTARVRNGNLLIRGFLGISLLGRTQTFVPLATCNEDILRMIRESGMQGTPCDARRSEAN